MDEDLEAAPCGCKFGNRGDAFVFKPHALDCDLYAYVKAETAAQGKPIYTVQEN